MTVPATAQAAFPGANGKIVFASTRDDANPSTCSSLCNWELYTINPDGSGITRLTNTPSPLQEGEPSWSPDGQRIIFQRYDQSINRTTIHVMNADGSGETQLLSSFANAFYPAFSPDGSKIVFKSGSGSFTANADGTGAVNIYPQNANGHHPAWSPDGGRIAIGTFGNQCISLVDPDGSNGSPLVCVSPQRAGDYVQRASWSPDGTRVAFDAWTLGGTPPSGLTIVNRDGSGSHSMSTYVEEPSWSPDGQRLAVAVDNDIGAINPDGSGLVKLTNDPARDRTPDWQPLRALNPFPRPGGGSPLITYLVPAYEQCASPNTRHVGPLAEGSCAPPVQTSDLLTTSKIGQGKGFVRLDVMAGNPSTAADEADVRIEASISDVRNASDQSDYSGQVLVSSTLRITDRASGFGGVSGTVSDFRFDVPVTCTPSVPAPNGSDCQILTTADTLVPGMVAEGKRSVISSFNLNVLDAGLDGDVTPASGCPPTCGTGDEQVYLTQGVFTP